MKGKKGASWLAYILATALFVSLSVGMIMWYTSYAEDTAQGTVKFVEGRMECRSIKLASDYPSGDVPCGSSSTLTRIDNKGTLNIDQIIVQYPDHSEPLDNSKIIAGKSLPISPITLNNQMNLTTIVPLINVRGGLVGCLDSRLLIECINS